MSLLHRLGNVAETLDDRHLRHLSEILDGQAAESAFSGLQSGPVHKEWSKERKRLDVMINERSQASMLKVVGVFAKILDTLEMYSPNLKGLQHVHSFACERLEALVFDVSLPRQHVLSFGFLYGQAMGLSPVTGEGAALAVENLLHRGDIGSIEISLCILLGVERSNYLRFEANLPTLLRQVQACAFGKLVDKTVPREALLRAMAVYSPTEKASSCRHILDATHALLAASLVLCETPSTEMDGVVWTCFIIENTPMKLRQDLRKRYPQTCHAIAIFTILQANFERCNPGAQEALCGALPILATWDTPSFVDRGRVGLLVNFMMSLPHSLQSHAMKGLGQLASVVLDRFANFLDEVGSMALTVINEDPGQTELFAAQQLLTRLLASLGPISTNVMIEYLKNDAHILLADVGLLEMIATLLPNLSKRIIVTLVQEIDKCMLAEGRGEDTETALVAVLVALKAFPLSDAQLVDKAQDLVLWCLDESKGQAVVVGALDLVTEDTIATLDHIRNMTYKASQLLLAEDPVIVHFALNKLSNPSLANWLDEKSCRMILLALHQSLEPSIQVVAAKLLTHLATAHRAIVQPLAWSHIRQSFSLMDFLKTVDPPRAIVEACIISNLLPALPSSLHRKYVRPVKELILSGLEKPKDGHLLSLIFQGLANLAKFEGWGSAQQSDLANDLLEMSQEIPRDSQHAALNAISRLLAVPQDGLDVYNLLLSVHTAFGGRHMRLDADLKALVAGIYGHLGTVERDPMISRDSKAAITRETTFYTPKSVCLAQVAEIRDKSGADSQSHTNWLVTKSLMSAMSSAQRATDERSLVLEVMTSLGILQPRAIPTLIADLPALIMRDLRYGLAAKDQKDSTPTSIAILFLSSSLHTSPLWLEQYWVDAADVFSECIASGEALSVLQGMDVILEAIEI